VVFDPACDARDTSRPSVAAPGAAHQFMEVVDRVLALGIEPTWLIDARSETLLHCSADFPVLMLDLDAEATILIAPSTIAAVRIGRIAVVEFNPTAVDTERDHAIGLQAPPAGAAIDRFGVRWPSTLLCLLLAAVVWQLSAFAGSLALLFTLLLATRALGQSALSVASISTVAKSARQRTGVAMAIFSVLLSVWFAVAFGIIGYVVRDHGWRIAWQQIALVLAFAIAPLAMILLRHPSRGTVTRTKDEPNGYTLSAALRTPAFWVFTAAAALFNLVSSGLGLFNEAVLAERGFPRNTFHHFLVVTTLLSLAGQLLCGWLTLRWSMRQISAFSLLLYAAGLGMLPFVRSEVQLWIIALFVGLSGGLIIVIFFTVWPVVFGRANVGQIQGAAQVCTVISSAIGPVLFAKCFQSTGSYSPALWILAGIVLLNATAAWRVSMPQRTRPP
jgi:MFS family permease